jgi:signal transduction histidine kinase
METKGRGKQAMPRILIVEDSPTQAQRLALILEEEGFAVAIAPDADRGFECLNQDHFDLVLSDLLLPGDSGFDLCRRIRNDPRHCHLPVVVHTSQADPANVLRGLEAGADGFMTKDRESEEIVRRIRRALACRTRSTGTAGNGQTCVHFLNQEYKLSAGPEHLLDVLVSAFEDVVHLNDRLQESAAALQASNSALGERNRQLQELTDELAARILSERRAHEELQQAHDELKKAQGQLVQSEKLASLGQLAAGMAHEINNPLSYVTNNLVVLHRDVGAALKLLTKYREGRELMAQTEPSRAAEMARLEEEMDLPYFLGHFAQLFEKSLGGLRRVRDIVKNLRDFARLDEAEYKEADLNSALVSTIEILRHEIQQKGIQVRTQFGEIPPVMCQPGKINQVFLNLLLNAVQASDPGGVVEVRTSLESAAAVRIDFQDNGCGIKPEHLPHLFEPFFTTKPVGEGKGLGLAVSYGIIRDHGGSITVDSQPGLGSRFRVRIPLQAGLPPAR